ncbi:MAG TPA: hypothetical protein IAC03_02850 [Candidatus Coprenecus pullistercoris]|nr:hypothetical protein [Candidatus Coprenecus pullistercoris]
MARPGCSDGKTEGNQTYNMSRNESVIDVIKVRNDAIAVYDSDSATDGYKKIASVAVAVAEMIVELLPEAEVQYMVKPSRLSHDADKDALPIHFLFSKGGRPILAVVVVTSNGYNAPRVLITKSLCENSGIRYLRVYADGYYGDWIDGYGPDGCRVKLSKAGFVKKWFADSVKKYLS